MSTKSIITKLIKAIDMKRKPEKINEYRRILVESITEASKEELFYSLPLSEISNIINQVDFSNEEEVEEPFLLLQTLIEKTKEFHEKESVLLLNDIKFDNFPEPTLDELIPIVSKFTGSEILMKLVELYTYEKSLVRPDYEHTIEKLKGEIAKKNAEITAKNNEIEELKKRIKALEEERNRENTTQTKETATSSIKFTPVTAKPKIFFRNIYEAVKKGFLECVQYHYEVLHTNIQGTFTGRVPGYASPASGLTYLHIASAYGHLNIVQYLFEVVKINPEATEENNRTALHYASENGHLPIVKYLCEVAKVNAEVKDFLGFTAVFFASLNGHLPVVQYLCEVAKVNMEGTYGITRNEEVRKYLESIGIRK